MTPLEFVQKWRDSRLKERSGAPEHFIDVCRLLGQPTPAEADSEGAWYTFERGAAKSDGGQGFADVWMKGHFAWEYKGKRANLAAAYRQLLQYREDLENPPLLVVSDMDRFEVHTNFTGTAKTVYTFTLPDLIEPVPTPTCPLPPLEVLRDIFLHPDRLRPNQSTAQVTEQAAAEFAKLSASLRKWGVAADEAAHFLMRLLFCLFAEDIGLLPEQLFTRLVQQTRTRPKEFQARLGQLYEAMATGGSFGVDDIPYFNGGLFADGQTFELTGDDLDVLARACRLDWSSIEPAIFGTLFERSLNPDKRSQLGAHYTSRADIELIVEPVLLGPLRRRWDTVQAEALSLVARRDAAGRETRERHQRALQRLLSDFIEEIAATRVLDPACGSGNFLYVALKRLLDLEKEVITFAGSNGLTAFFPRVEPHQLHGIEINPYAQELAQIVVWIGYIQWLHDNGFGIPASPILKPLHTIQCQDAILGFDEAGRPVEPEWPEAEVIIGNPPFLGTKKMRSELGDKYVEDLRRLYSGRVVGFADLVCYWFERSRSLIADGKVRRAGLLATNSITGGKNRQVLDRIKETGSIFMAWRDRPWVLDGAAVRVSMVGFDSGVDSNRWLDGEPVSSITSSLTSTLDIAIARRLSENLGIAFIGDVKGGAFDIPPDIANTMLHAPVNPNGRPNSDVVRPWVNGLDMLRRSRGMWIIDFGVHMLEVEASLYEAPYEYVRKYVYPLRSQNRRPAYAHRWWLHVEPCSGMRKSIAKIERFLVTTTMSKHRVFTWLTHPTLPDHQLTVIARDDDYFFGVLHSKSHELWTLRMCSWLGVGNDPRYTPTTTFETFPFPWPPGNEPAGDSRVEAIAEAARDLVEKRDRWLNPDGATEAELKKRTLTNLYNQRPTWLDQAHRRLDVAVFDAYGWPHDLTDDQILERLLALNLARAEAQ